MHVKPDPKHLKAMRRATRRAMNYPAVKLIAPKMPRLPSLPRFRSDMACLVLILINLL